MTLGEILYEIPSTKYERSFSDSIWFCPRLFSSIDVDQFEKLLSAVLLERSIVFVGKQSCVSAAILGLHSLLYPFKWCLALVPILPHPLIEMIEAPLPLLVGITYREYRDLSLSQCERDSKIWVFLETGNIVWNKDGFPLSPFSIN